MKTALRAGQCDFEMVPLCPYCGKKYLDTDDDPITQEDEYWQQVQCAHCQKDFKVTVHAIYRFESEPIEEWENVEQPEPEKCDIPF